MDICMPRFARRYGAASPKFGGAGLCAAAAAADTGVHSPNGGAASDGGAARRPPRSAAYPREVLGGVRAAECAELLVRFFQDRRGPRRGGGSGGGTLT